MVWFCPGWDELMIMQWCIAVTKGKTYGILLKSQKTLHISPSPVICQICMESIFAKISYTFIKFKSVLEKIYHLMMTFNYILENFDQVTTKLNCIVDTEQKCHHFDDIFITGCTGSCQNDNFQCSQWWKFYQNNDISISVENNHIIIKTYSNETPP